MGIPHKILSEDTYNLSSGTFFTTTRYLLQNITTSSFESVPKKYTKILGWSWQGLRIEEEKFSAQANSFLNPKNTIVSMNEQHNLLLIKG